MRATLVVPFLCLFSSTISAQGPRSADLRAGFEWQSGETGTARISSDAIRLPSASSRRIRKALIGGAIGAAAGAVVCTVISNIADDAAVDRFTTCTFKGYLLTGSIGFGAGFLTGWLSSP